MGEQAVRYDVLLWCSHDVRGSHARLVSAHVESDDVTPEVVEVLDDVASGGRAYLCPRCHTIGRVPV